MQDNLLTQKQLANKWQISERTLERWRSIGQGPHYFKLGGVIRYCLESVLAFEQQSLRQSATTEKTILSFASNCCKVHQCDAVSPIK